jgi:predicted RNase H-like HicB family nuclease
MNYTISIQKNKNGWLTGQCEQIPEAITEGRDMDHLMKNMYDAIKEALDIRKEDFLESHQSDTRIRRILYLPNEKKRTAKTSKRKQVHA